jgi:hypothetical protein
MKEKITDKAIILPKRKEFPCTGGTFDKFTACHWLQCPETDELLVLETRLRRVDDGFYYGSYRITDVFAHTPLMEIEIDNDGEARYLYHRFRALNPEFVPCGPYNHFSAARRLPIPSIPPA